MRFIFGILIGAALTLFAATAVDAPTNPLFDKVVNLWDAIIETTSEALFENTAFNTSPNAPPNTARESTTETPESPFAIAADAESPFAIAADALEVLAQRLPRSESAAGDVSLPALPTSQGIAEVGVAVETLEQQPEPADIAVSAPAPLASAEAGVEVAADANVDPGNYPEDTIEQTTGNASMPVWVSFHSQMSAEGFARQLSDQFHHPFAVARQGPGDYQVVFDYGSIDERDALLDEIAAVTGYRAP